MDSHLLDAVHTLRQRQFSAMTLCICVAMVAIVMALTIRRSMRPRLYDAIEDYEAREPPPIQYPYTP